MAILIAAILYFAIVFAFAFAMGVARTLAVTPWLGPTAAVLLEIPAVLAVSWIVARRLLRDRPFDAGQCAAMGAIAFALLMVSEAALAGVLRGQTLVAWAHDVATPLGLIGLAGQIGFAAMPLVVGRGVAVRT
jgi:hypothetical protein